MNPVASFSTRPSARRLAALFVLMLWWPAHAQQAVQQQSPAASMPSPDSVNASVWQPKAASAASEFSEGIAWSPLMQKTDPGIQQWQVLRADVSVRRLLQRWGREAGWQVVWDAPRDFPIETEVQLSGRIEQVVSAVVESLAVTDFPVQARINSELHIIRIGRYLEGQAR